MNPIIKVNHISKRYKLGQIQGYKTIRESLSNLFQPKKPSPLEGEARWGGDYIWALKDVSFEVQPGEVVGIIGRNGAGKSTLLKILTRITEPTEGTAELKGRVSSLLEVGTGFHPELTGRENIYLNGAILGMRKAEISKKFDEIVAFAEVEKFIDTPVKRYSSGMYVRLAFAVAAHLEPEILLVDEVLAVGDAAFQKKCLGKMGDVAKGGRTILFVSHNMGAINQLCATTLWIDQGRIVELGPTNSIINKYLTDGNLGNAGEFRAHTVKDAPGNEKARLWRVSVKNDRNETTNLINADSPVIIEIEYEIKTYLKNVRIAYRLIANDGTIVFTSSDTDPQGYGIDRKPGVYVSRGVLSGNFLNNGCYYVLVACSILGLEELFCVENIVNFTVIQPPAEISEVIPFNRLGVTRPVLNWKIYSVDGKF